MIGGLLITPRKPGDWRGQEGKTGDAPHPALPCLPVHIAAARWVVRMKEAVLVTLRRARSVTLV